MADLGDLVEQAFEALARPEDEKGEIEYDLAGGKPWDVQLRKGCRYLATAEHCLVTPGGAGGYYTGAVELSLAAIERSLQAVLMEAHGYRMGDFHDHEATIIRAGDHGVLDRGITDRLRDLWAEFRSETYYRLGIPDRVAAEAVLTLARAVHRDLAGRKARYRGACKCPQD